MERCSPLFPATQLWRGYTRCATLPRAARRASSDREADILDPHGNPRPTLKGDGMTDASCDIGLIGLAVMGQNLVLNMNDHGFKVAVFNRTVSKVDDFLADEAKGTKVVGAQTIEELTSLLKRPRRGMLMVKAGGKGDRG